LKTGTVRENPDGLSGGVKTTANSFTETAVMPAVLTGSGDGSVQWQEVQCKDADNALIQLLQTIKTVFLI
jgi:hypothetical protein